MPEILDIINIDDQVIGQATREDVYAHKHIHRIIHVIVRDSSGRQLLQLRSAGSKYLPLHWSTAVGGHIHAGESYEDAARREMEEEIGITGSELREVGTFFYEGDGLQKYLGVFETVVDGGFTLSEREVADVQFFSPEEAKKLIMTGEKIHPELKFLWGKLYTKRYL